MIRKMMESVYVIASASAAVAALSIISAPGWCYDVVLVLLVSYISKRV